MAKKKISEAEAMEAAIAEAIANPEPEGAAATPPADGKRYVLHEKRGDKFSLKRKWVEITPAVCDICGYDLIAKYHPGRKFMDLPTATQASITTAIEMHKQEQHPIRSGVVVRGDELPTEYLSRR